MSCFVNAFVHRSNQPRISFAAALSPLTAATFFVCAFAVPDASAIKMKMSNMNRFILFIWLPRIMKHYRHRRDGKLPRRCLILPISTFRRFRISIFRNEGFFVHDVWHFSLVAAVLFLQNVDESLYAAACHALFGIDIEARH